MWDIEVLYLLSICHPLKVAHFPTRTSVSKDVFCVEEEALEIVSQLSSQMICDMQSVLSTLTNLVMQNSLVETTPFLFFY